MKSPLIAGVAGLTLIALTATTIYAQVAGSTSIVDKMKAAVHTFTLASDLNPGQTGYESAPVSGKKTGNMLTAAEWNRMLELISQGTVGAAVGGVGIYKCTNAQSLDTNNAPCYGASRNGGAGTNQYRVVSCSNTDASGTYTAGGLLNFGDFIANKWSFHINNSNIACTDGSVLVMDITGGGGGSSGSVPANLTYINPDNTDFAPLECTPGMNYMINPIAFSAASASTYTDKKLAILKPGNWRAKGTNFSRNRNITSGSSHTLRFNSIIDGVTDKLYENTVDLGLYASSFSKDITVPAGKIAEINVSVRNNTIYGGTVTVWCIN